MSDEPVTTQSERLQPPPPRDIDSPHKLRPGSPQAVWAVQQLAAGWQHGRIAEALGVSRQAVSLFASRNRERIEEVAKDASAAINEQWIASKAARIADYQRQVEQCDRAIMAAFEAATAGMDDGERAGLSPSDVVDPKLLKARQTALRSVAEELGQLPSRVIMPTDMGGAVQWKIVGVEPETVGGDG